MKIWRLKKGADRRVRQGHPWVFASELAHSAREVEPGELVELRDAANSFIARGSVHPTAAIAFRKWTANQRETLDVEFFRRRLLAARALRESAGWAKFSHRWIYAESDGLPGFVVDLFSTAKGPVVVVQASTAGAERALPQMLEALRSLAPELENTGSKDPASLVIVEAPSSTARPREGLSVAPKRMVHGARGDLNDLEFELADDLKLRADFLGGQKTGFFLDQQANARALARWLGTYRVGERLRVLDICCYVGQWAAHVARARRGLVDVDLLDVSEAALAFAKVNVEAQGASVQTYAGDALARLETLKKEDYDVVICDPPAFVKKTADFEAGLRAYTKLNRDAMRLVRPGAIFVASSCSGLVKSADFKSSLALSAGKAGRLFREIWAGGHGPDHPVRLGFPEGEYLKCLIGRVDHPF